MSELCEFLISFSNYSALSTLCTVGNHFIVYLIRPYISNLGSVRRIINFGPVFLLLLLFSVCLFFVVVVFVCCFCFFCFRETFYPLFYRSL